MHFTRPTRAVAATAAVLAVGATTGIAGAARTTRETKVVKRVVFLEHGHRVTATTFRRNGKTYRRKQWTTRHGSHLVLHTVTYLLHGRKAKKIASQSRTESGSGAVSQQMIRTCAPGDPGAAQAAYGAFLAHVQAAHLGEGIDQQVADLLDVSHYVQLHTALVGNMVSPAATDAGELPAALQELVGVFEAHIQAAHLHESPLQQAKDITGDPDGYIQLHTVLVANMAAPLVAWSDNAMAGTPESCSEQPAPPSSGSAPGGQAIAIKDNTFPKETDVSPGTKVTWTNDDDVAHTVTSMHGGPLKSGNLDKGASYSYTFSQAGTFMYACDVHPDMQSQVVVR